MRDDTSLVGYFSLSYSRSVGWLLLLVALSVSHSSCGGVGFK